MTQVLKQAIHDSEQSIYAIAMATGLEQSSLRRFMWGETSLRLDLADKLAAHLGLVLRKEM